MQPTARSPLRIELLTGFNNYGPKSIYLKNTIVIEHIFSFYFWKLTKRKMEVSSLNLYLQGKVKVMTAGNILSDWTKISVFIFF